MHHMNMTATAIRALAATRGFDLNKLTKKALARRPKERVVPPKYCDPTNPAAVWSGRGKQPLWFREAIENGATPEQLLIPAASITAAD